MYEILFRYIFLLITLSCVANAAITAYGVCVNPRQETGICIQIKDCDYFLDILNKTASNGINPTDAKFLRESQCGQDNSQDTLAKKVLVCCPDNYRSTLATRNGISEKNLPGNVLPEPGVCGEILTDRILGGNITKIDEFPWMALLQYKTGPDRYGLYCGGSLINSRYVLTAGHCLKHPDMPSTWELHSVRLGEWDLTTNPDCVIDVRGRKDCVDPHRDVLIDYAMAHPLYVPTSKNQFNDIALIRMAESVKTTDFIIPICLPLTASLRQKRFTSTAMDVAGWGATENDTVSTIKLKIMVNVWNTTKCQDTYNIFNMPIDENYQFCAGGADGIDTCRGDSGGPLMVTQRIKNKDVYFVIGIVSYGPRPCGLEGWPGVYTRVGNYTDWILNNLLP
ncbi:Serine protease easter [Lucilia cuprina]|uniref:CLIP domain-containing serine protease n=1 Tax=Lucilia cuprina TaxID=7375 RepID=A0A0L0CQ15_LUCCU|nr:Serine protease easter [Lucilia cuprina]KNC34443.1 Serine protease easter [Lucilia cuprina]